MPAISSDVFTWNARDMSLSANLSDVREHFHMTPYGKRGIKIRSDRTGHIEMFLQSGEARDDEGELRYIVLEPLKDSVRRNPKLKGVRVVLSND